MSEASEADYIPPGTLVRVRNMGDSEWTLGAIALCSKNGRSFAITLEGPVRGGGGIIAGVLPILVDNGRALGLTGDEYEIEGPAPTAGTGRA